MKLLDSDLLGILLALLTFILPAVSGVLEKKRKEKKRREAELYSHAQPEYPQEQQTAESEEDAHKLNEEIEELFNVLMGKDAEQEDILPDSFHEPQTQESWQQEPLQCEETLQYEPATEEIPVPMHQLVEEQVESQTEQVQANVEPEPGEKNSLKSRIKGNPKEAIILSEILTPKFKEYEN